MPGVWAEPVIEEAKIRDMRTILQYIKDFKFLIIESDSDYTQKIPDGPTPLYRTPLEHFRFLDFELWEIPWVQLWENHEKSGTRLPLSIRIKTDRNWAVKTRIPYNREKKDVRDWRCEMDIFLDQLLGVGHAGLRFSIPPGKEVKILWKNGEPLLEVFRNAIPLLVAEYANKLASLFYYQKAVSNKLRRMGMEPAPFHVGPHSFSKNMGNLCDTHYGGVSNLIRLYAEANNPELFYQTAPIYAWTNKFFETIQPECFRRMWGSGHPKFHVCGSVFDVNVLNFDNVLPHWDVEKFPALLSYLSGLAARPWGGGELVIPELQLQIYPRPLDHILLDSILIHYVGVVTGGTRFNITSYRGGIQSTSAVIPGSEWIGLKNFGI